MSDPFDDLDDEDREGDPFADLDEAEPPGPADATDGVWDEPEAADAGAGDSRERDSDGDPFNYLGDSETGGPETTAERDEGVGDRPEVEAIPSDQVDVAGDPFGDMDISRGDPFESSGSHFQQVDVTSVDPDEVWKRFTGEAEPAGSAAEPREEVEEVVVSKHEFCEGCPHFTAPPDIECTHEGTSILEFLDPDEVRVKNCPIVRERRELGEVHD
jgi:hypothetical protein